MKKHLHFILFASSLFLLTQHAVAQTVWDGATLTFTKASGADPNTEAAQDRITSNVWITRGNNGGQIYNAKTDPNSGKLTSPADTEWAEGAAADYATLTFQAFRSVGKPQSLVNKNLVCHLITDDIYIDVKFTSWGNGGGGRNGGGSSFTYERSTDPSLSVDDLSREKIQFSPNPSFDYLQVSGLTGPKKYSIYNILGVAVKTGETSNNQKIGTQNISSGLYLLKFENGDTFKFLKK